MEDKVNGQAGAQWVISWSLGDRLIDRLIGSDHSLTAVHSAIIWVFPRGLALFDATVHFSCICFVL